MQVSRASLSPEGAIGGTISPVVAPAVTPVMTPIMSPAVTPAVVPAVTPVVAPAVTPILSPAYGFGQTALRLPAPLLRFLPTPLPVALDPSNPRPLAPLSSA